MLRYRGWEVELEDGTIIFEEDTLWIKVPKKKIKRLTLHYDGRQWNLTGKTNYFVKNTVLAFIGVTDPVIESRGIGYYEGKDKILYSVNELTGKFIIKVING